MPEARTPTDWKPLAAYLLPFALFMLGMVVEGLEISRPFYPFVYMAKVLAVTAALAWGFRYYPRFEARGMLTGVLLGILGGVVWVVLCTWNIEQRVLPEVAEWLNWPQLNSWLKPSSRLSYNPFLGLGKVGGWLFVVIRLYGLILVVPVMEEIFWRGFLNRYLVHENWRSVPWGRFTVLSFSLVTLAFIFAHTEWTAALVWGIGINLVLILTRNLWTCVAAHAASNAVLGYYILVYEQWKLW